MSMEAQLSTTSPIIYYLGPNPSPVTIDSRAKLATLPANLLPALPRFCNFPDSFSLSCDPLDENKLPPPLPPLVIVGSGPSVSPAPLPIDPDPIPDVLAVRCSMYNRAAADSGIAGNWTGTSAPFWISSSAIGNAFGLAVSPPDAAVLLGETAGDGTADPGAAGSAAASARKTAWVPRERSVALTLPRSAMP